MAKNRPLGDLDTLYKRRIEQQQRLEQQVLPPLVEADRVQQMPVAMHALGHRLDMAVDQAEGLAVEDPGPEHAPA